MHNFRELKVWKNSMKLVKGIYQASLNFPAEERYGLSSQIKRCAVSIPSNIAEGAGRGSDKEFTQFINISLGSSFELETQLILAHELNFIDKDRLSSFIKELHEIQKMLIGLNKKFSRNKIFSLLS